MHLRVKVLPLADLFQRSSAAMKDPPACSSAFVMDSFTMSPILASPSVSPSASPLVSLAALTIATLVAMKTIPAATTSAVLPFVFLESIL